MLYRARACGAAGHRVETLEEFEAAFKTALTSGRPTVIDARITRWALRAAARRPDRRQQGRHRDLRHAQQAVPHRAARGERGAGAADAALDR
ncbi:thiamine pyrophosphate-dependent enzyme [Streptomyces sp. NPDC006184]|uniref:thiamine pyrophosphate-dependent enzyme n=1 Tax=Streptomyces sp. NPDC006184 TaxID=3155455 RepID=UPI0033BC1F56